MGAQRDTVEGAGPGLVVAQPSPSSPLPGRRGFLLAAIGLSLLASAHTWHYALVGTDDALIYFRAARNVAAGFGPVMNPGDTHAVGTSLLWTYLLAAGHALLGGCDLPTLARVLTALLTFGSCLLLSLALRPTIGELALLAPLGILSIGLFRAVVGLETPLAVLAVSFVLFCHFARGSLPLTGAALGLAFFCRGDAIVLAVPIALHVVVTRDSGERSRAFLLAVGRGLLAFALVLGLGLVLHRLATGAYLPSTLATKMIQGAVGPWHTYGKEVSRYLLQALGGHWWLAALAVAGAVLLRWSAVVLLGAAALHWLAYSRLQVADYPWYSWLLQLAVGLCLVVGIGGVARLLARWLAQGRRQQATALAALAASVALVAATLVGFGEVRRFAPDRPLQDCGFIRTYHEVAGLLCGPVASGSRSGPGATLLGEEIGVIAYECAGLVIRDVNGVASPGLTPENLNRWEYWVEKYEPEYLVVRGDTGPSRVFADFDRRLLWAYRRLLLVRDPEFIPVSVYQREDSGRAGSALGSLGAVMGWEVEAPERRFISLPSGRIALFAPAPSSIRLDPPSGARRLTVGFGLVSLPAAARGRADGVVFRVVAVRADGGEQELLRREQPPVFEGDAARPADVEVPLGPACCRQLLLLVEPNGNTDWDWAYWSEVTFDTG